jgi:alpha-L-rhamnosidase
MFGSIDAWFYRIIGGISCILLAWKEIQFKPPEIAELSYAAAKLKTVRGNISISWQRSANCFYLNVQIPIGSTGKVCIPINQENGILFGNEEAIWENGKIIENKLEIQSINIEKKYLTFTCGSGDYYFKLIQDNYPKKHNEKPLGR